MSWNTIQTSFSSGELSPSMFARVDLAAYKAGLDTCRNFFVDYRSGVSTRMGTKFVIQAFKSSTAVRVISFQTSVLVPYILEFGDLYMRPISKGAPVLEPSFNVTAATQANPCVITVPANNFAAGNIIYVSGVGGMVQLDNRFFQVLAVAGNAVTLGDSNGVPVNSLAYAAFTSAGLAARVFQIASPYAAADLALLKFVQVVNTMYLTHPSYAPMVLTFISPTNWTFVAIVFGTTLSAPGLPVITGSAVGTANYAYEVTAVDSNGQESLPSAPGVGTNLVNIGSTAGTITVTGAGPVTGAQSYNYYKAELSVGSAVPTGAGFGFIMNQVGTTLVDSNIVPDFTLTPPVAMNPFTANNPGAPCFFQQRLYYGGSTTFPQTFWGSQPGFYNNFNVSDPIQADDAITGTLVSLQVNYIKSMVPMPGGLIIFTAKGAWQLSSGGGGLASASAVTPINATATPQSYIGSNDVPPIPINQDVLYIQAKGYAVRSLQYNIYANIYAAEDISIFSNHLFFGYQLTQWAYAEEPFKIVWAVRNDGRLLSLTWLAEQKIMGWARHDTLGLFQSVASVTEDNLDAVYFVVKRLIGGRWVQMIERMADRLFPYGAEDAWCVDCGIESGSTSPAVNITISAATGTVVVLADAGVFSASSVGQIIRAGKGIMTVTTLVSAFQVQATVTKAITDTLPNSDPVVVLPIASGDWTIAPQSTTFYGLDFLEGQTVQILADGNVVTPQVVTNGSITLAQAASKVIVGLKFLPQFRTLRLEVGNTEDTAQSKRKKISALTMRCTDTRGLSFGQTFGALSPIKEFSQSMSLGQTIPLITGDTRVIMDPLWNTEGQICLQQDNPLPATVLGVIPEITLGDTKDRSP